MWIPFLSTTKNTCRPRSLPYYTAQYIKKTNYCGHNGGIPGGARGYKIPGGSMGPWKHGTPSDTPFKIRE